MRDLSEPALEALLESQQERLKSLSIGSMPTKEELEILESFWNPHFHTLRDWVPLVAIVDRETQRLTSLNDCATASSLVCARVKALMVLGYIGDELVERQDGSPSSARLWLTAKGATHFSTGIPNILRRPVTFARRHLSLFQLAAVLVTITAAIATFVARVLGWVG
jgi:hypothetical protein